MRDPGGVFASNDHRRVLGHLAIPGDEMAWTDLELFERMIPDVGSDLNPEQVTAILHELRTDGLAACRDDETWQLTDLGLAKLTGPNAQGNDDEPTAALIAEAGRRQTP